MNSTFFWQEKADGVNRPKQPAQFFVDALIDAFAPLLTYFVLHGLGVAPLVSLIAGSLVAIISTVVHTMRRKRLDGVGLLIIAEIGVSILLQCLTGDPRILMIKPSFYSLMGAIYLAATTTGIFGHRPLTYEGARPMATQGDPQRAIAYEQAWVNHPPFRRLHLIATLGWSMAFFADALLRVVIVYSVPVERAVWLSNVPHIVAIIVLVGFSALVGRTAKPVVDEQVRLLPPESKEKENIPPVPLSNATLPG